MRQQIVLFDESTGEIISKSERALGTALGDGWVVLYDSAIRKLLKDRPEPMVYQTFLTLAVMQPFDVYTITTVKNLAKQVGGSYKAVWSAVRWLEEHKYLKRTTVNGATAFLLNPNMTTRGRKSLPEKKQAWSMKLGGTATPTASDDAGAAVSAADIDTEG